MEAQGFFFIRRLQKQYPNKRIQVWFQDESRFGQKGSLYHQWARRGGAGRISVQNGFKCAYLIGAVNPRTGRRVGWLSEKLDTDVMNAFLRDVSTRIDCHSHAVLVVDRASWHRSKTLAVPANITLLHLPPYCPELNPIERLWLYMKRNFLSGRIFKDLAEVMDAGKKAWQRLGKNIIRSICAVYDKWLTLL